jgi:hypothetical protein
MGLILHGSGNMLRKSAHQARIRMRSLLGVSGQGFQKQVLYITAVDGASGMTKCGRLSGRLILSFKHSISPLGHGIFSNQTSVVPIQQPISPWGIQHMVWYARETDLPVLPLSNPGCAWHDDFVSRKLHGGCASNRAPLLKSCNTGSLELTRPRAGFGVGLLRLV